jgi:Leucine-rich repeat (LRR) protein
MKFNRYILFYSYLLVAIASTATAQTHIPDQNFAVAIHTACPTCIDPSTNNLLPPAAKLTTLNVRKSNIVDLTGVAGFTALQNMICDSNEITILPILPANLQYLNCGYNKLTNLANLPSPLTSLSCYYNQLVALPTLPNKLQQLYCYNNQLTVLPTLPNSFQYLNCGYNKLTILPTLPSSLISLYCYNNQLTTLPTLPNSLQYLNCSYNKLSNLSLLPTNLISLYCASNLLTTLPSLPNVLQDLDISYNTSLPFPILPAGLKNLTCRGNKLTKLPDLPLGLISLYCSSNQLTVLPTLPNSLKNLDFGYNLLADFPVLPAGLQFLNCSGHKFTKLPELPQGLTNLQCSANQLTELPTLPKGLVYLYCNDNKLTALPALPNGLQQLWTMNTLITCLPTLPNTLKDLRIDPTKIGCLPNAISKLKVYKGSTGVPLNDIILTPPVCSAIFPKIETLNPVICLGQSATLSADGCSVGTVKWSNNATGNSIMVNPTINSSYTAVCSTACGDGNKSNSVVVTISGIVPSIPVVSADIAALCVGQSTVITATNCNGTVKWSNNIVGNSISVSPTAATSYSAICQNSCGTSDSSKNIVVTIKPIVPKPSINGSNFFCPNGTATLTSSISGNYTYIWKRNGQDINTNQSIPVNNEGTYSLIVSTNGCSNRSDDFLVQKTTPTTALSGKADFCLGSSTTLTASTQNTSGTIQYQWKQGNANVGDGKNTLVVNQSGSYSLDITDANGCKAQATAITVTEKGTDLVATISPPGPITVYAPDKATLNATLGYENNAKYSYQWKKDGTNIAGANSYVYQADASGNYTVSISSQECSITSSIVVVKALLPTAVLLSEDNVLHLFPNPTSDVISVRADFKNPLSLDLKLLDLQGKELQSYQWPRQRVHNQTVDLTNYPAGGYLLQLRGVDFEKTIKIVKN